MMIKEAVIIAGGKGTRLKKYLNNIPKPMVEIDGLPLIHRQINQIIKYGYTKVSVLVSYKSEIIKDYLSRHIAKDISVEFYEDKEPLGTAGSLLKIADRLSEQILVLYGDTLFDIDIKKFENFHSNNKTSVGSIFLHPNSHPYDSDLVSLNEKNIIDKFYNYPHKKNTWLPNLVNAAMYILNKEKLLQFKDFKTPCDFAKDFFPFLLEKNLILSGYVSPEYIKDVGTPDRIEKAIEDIKNQIPIKSNLINKQKAIFLDRDGVINYLRHDHVKNDSELKIFDYTALAIRLFNINNFKVILVTNQPVISRGECTLKELKNIHNKLETIVGEEKAFIDKIYFCPHHPDSGYPGEIKSLKIKCLCRKPNTKLIEDAIRDFNIDIKQSWYIGDSTTDLLTATKMKIKHVMLSSGSGGLDGKYSVQNQYNSDNLLTAAEFITSGYDRSVNKLASLIYEITKSNKLNWFVTGFSKSGKSMFSNIIYAEINKANRPVHVISLDRWILAKNNRGSDLISRFDTESIFTLFQKICKQNKPSNKYRIPNYDKMSRNSHEELEEVIIQKNSIIIWEGVIAGYIAEKLNLLDELIYIKEDEPLRIKRLIKEYENRNCDQEKISQIIQSRNEDELPIIENYENKSKYILSK
jgi:histidinol-phosphate phosphatase family protein